MANYRVKACAHVIAKYLTNAFTKFLEHGVVPEDGKLANVVPIHKSGSRNNVENYKPISLTSQCLKLK